MDAFVGICRKLDFASASRQTRWKCGVSIRLGKLDFKKIEFFLILTELHDLEFIEVRVLWIAIESDKQISGIRKQDHPRRKGASLLKTSTAVNQSIVFTKLGREEWKKIFDTLNIV